MDEYVLLQLGKCVKKYPAIRLFLTFGSRTRSQEREDSDWDFGYIAKPDFDEGALYSDLVLLLNTDKVDLIDLSHASGLLRFRAAQDGMIIFESSKGEYEKFWYESVNFWCEVSSLLRAEYNAILGNLQ